VILKNWAFSKRFIICVSIAFVVASLPGCKNRSGPASLPECRIGLVMPATGEMAPYGAEGVIAGRIALGHARANAKYSKPVLLEQDSGSQVTDANAAAATLLAPPNSVNAIVGEINSADTAAMVSQARVARVPILAPTASMIDLTRMSGQVFRIWPSDAYEATRMKDYVQSLGIKKIGVLYIQVPYGEEMANYFAQAFKESGGQVTIEGYPVETLDFKPLLLRMQGFDRLYIVSYIEDATLLLKRAYELSRTTGHKFQFFGTSVLDSSKLVDKAGVAANGIIFAVVQPINPGETPERADFIREYQNAREASRDVSLIQAAARDPGFAAFHVYDAVNLAFSACDASAKSGAPSGDGITNYFRTMPMYMGVTGAIRFDLHGDLATERSVVFKEIVSGKIVPLGVR